MTGEIVKEKLYQAHIPQSVLAEKLGMSKQLLSNTLGSKDIKSGLLERICEAIGVDMSFFYPPKDGQTVGIVSSPYSATAVGQNTTATSGASDDTISKLLDELSAQRQQNQQLLDILKSKI